MTFLSPAILFGLLAVGLPVAIHLLTRPRLRRVPWAAMRFLLQSVQKNKRRLQTEDLLLLLLRCLLVALLVLLFARPAFYTDAAAPELGGDTSTVVILLDNSASMGQSNGTQTRFDQAKSMADAILSKLAPGSSGALYLLADGSKAVIPKPTQDFAILRRSLAQASLTDRGTNLLPGLKAAVDLLKNSTGAHRDIFLLTDSQKPAWRELAKIRQLQDDNRKEIAIHFLVVGDKGEDNLAVTGLEMIGTVAAVNEPLRCAVRVTNWSTKAAERIPVKLATDNDAPQDEAMIDRIEPGASRSVNLLVRFREPGYHSITASIPGDRLPADNQRSLALLVLEQIRTLVVEGTTNPDPAARDGFFLRHALVPVRPDQVDQYPVKVAVGPPAELESSALDQYQIVFLSNVAQLTPIGAQNLKRYVNNGGALVIFPGPATDIAYYNGTLGPLLPAQLGPAQDAPAGHNPIGWQSRDYEHPVTTLWNEPASGNLNLVRTSRYYPFTKKSDSALVVVKYTNGELAALEQSVGKGKVFLFSSTATTAWNSQAIHPSFVPMLLRIIAYATSGPGGKLGLAPGQPFAFEIDSGYAGRELSILRPGDKKRRLAGQVEAGEHNALLRDTDTEQAGPYQLFVGDETKPKVVFAVQADPEESNLTQAPKSDIEPLLVVTDPATQTAKADDKPKPAAQRIPGPEIWFPLALAALLLACVETALAHRFSQSK